MAKIGVKKENENKFVNKEDDSIQSSYYVLFGLWWQKEGKERLESSGGQSNLI